MPGFDGTGPLGQGPMTGRGLGFCVLTSSEANPNETQGVAGLQAVPVSQKITKFENTVKEVINMPRGDGTGPVGMGPMTGRAAGFCAGYPVPGYMNPVVGRAGFYGAAVPGPYSAGAYGYGVPYAGRMNPWLCGGFGFGRGFGRARGWGRGRRVGRLSYWY